MVPSSARWGNPLASIRNKQIAINGRDILEFEYEAQILEPTKFRFTVIGESADKLLLALQGVGDPESLEENQTEELLNRVRVAEEQKREAVAALQEARRGIEIRDEVIADLEGELGIRAQELESAQAINAALNDVFNFTPNLKPSLKKSTIGPVNFGPRSVSEILDPLVSIDPGVIL